jgi:hypothetical protein
MEVLVPVFLALDGAEYLASPSDCLPMTKNPLYLLDKRVGGAQIRYGCIGEENIMLFRQGIKSHFSDWLLRSLVTVLTELPGLYVFWQ